MKYRKEKEYDMLKEMCICAHIELFKSRRYDTRKMEWFSNKIAEILADNFVWTVKTNLPILAYYFIFMLLLGIVIGRLLP